jgi:hypothetical protein
MTKNYDSAEAEINAFVKLQAQLPEEDRMPLGAGSALYALSRNLDEDTSMADLSRHLTRALADVSPETLDLKLRQQAQVLDAAFNWLMVRSVRHEGFSNHYQSAFAAQRLYRQSLQELNRRSRQKSANRTIKRTDKSGFDKDVQDVFDMLSKMS